MISPSRPSILIVEDEAIVAHDLQQTLADQGYDAFAIAASADEAYARARERPVDLVLMDIRIQGREDGIGAARALREQYRVPVVYLTAHADDATLERAKLTEPYGYLVKPIKPGELKSTVEIALHRHQGERELEQRCARESELLRRQEADKRLSALGTMAAGMAHELNNPLAVVVANAELVALQLKRQILDLRSGRAALPHAERLGETLEAQAELQLAASHIAHLVGDIRAFSPRPTAAGEDADVSATIEWAVARIAGELGPGTRLTQHAARLPRVALDEDDLRYVLLELLRNAAHAVDESGKPSAEIAVVAELCERDRIAIRVRDTGVGMRQDVLERIFEPFFTTRPLGRGVGLGLSRCHGIVRSAGGELSAESRLGRGTVLRLALPVAKRRETRVTPSTPPPCPRAQPARRRILVIDDEPMLLRSMRRVLAAHDVVCADSARQGLHLLSQSPAPFDVIVSDLMMPGMTGVDLYDELLLHRPEDARRVVFVTGGALTPRIDTFLQSIPNKRLEKPFAPDELLRTIGELLDN